MRQNVKKSLFWELMPKNILPPLCCLLFLHPQWKFCQLFHPSERIESSSIVKRYSLIGHLEHRVNATGNTKQCHQLVETEEVELGGNSLSFWSMQLSNYLHWTSKCQYQGSPLARRWAWPPWQLSGPPWHQCSQTGVCPTHRFASVRSKTGWGRNGSPKHGL